MKILLGYSWYVSSGGRNIRDHWENWISRLRKHGFDVTGYCLTLNPPGPCLGWPELDNLWKTKNKTLLTKYEDLIKSSEGFDVFVNYNGINVHPEFLSEMKTFNVYCCWDDPESSENLSKPVASAYDLCMVGNIACVENYLSWGAKRAEFWPIGIRDNEYNPQLTKEDILNGKRDFDFSLLCEKLTPDRIPKIDEFMRAFPQTKAFGFGWEKGYLPENLKVPLYQNTKIGPNIHLSKGPVNFRTYLLPANGVMQVCDNKSRLSKIYELDKEVIGFDTIKECIDKCRYYLEHDEERRKIAAAGWERAIKDYNEKTLFQKLINTVSEIMGSKNDSSV